MNLVSLLAAIAIFAAGDAVTPTKFPPDVEEALASSQEVMLYSLEPWARTESDGERFHNYKVLGKLTLNSSQRVLAVDAFRSAVSSYKDLGYAAACFDPRHALHVVNAGHTYDILLCYQCIRAQVFRDNESIASLGAMGSPNALNELLRRANVPVSTSGGNSE